MIVFLNGQFVPEAAATVSVLDRAFLYGDGLFETMRVCHGRPFRWAQHFARLERGAAFLGIKLPFSRDALADFAGELVRQNGQPEALLRLTLSRGVGPRGYSPQGAEQPTLVLTLHPLAVAADLAAAPLRWRAHTAAVRLPANEPLAQFKTCNKLAQILARAEAERAGADEALLLNTDGFVVEAASSNLFWFRGNELCTTPLSGGVLAGVTREVILELAVRAGLRTNEALCRTEELRAAAGAFLSLSSHGVVELAAVDGTALPAHPDTQRLHQAYAACLRAECGSVAG